MEYRGATSATKVYTEEERHAGLELAATVGPRAAARQLDVSVKTLYRWMDRYPKLWSDLRAGDPTAHRRGFAHRLEDLADRYAASENDLLDEIDDGKLKPTDAREAAALIKAMGSSRQAAVAGARVVSGDPDQVVEHQINFPALEQAMERLLAGGKDAISPQGVLVVENEAGCAE